MNKWEFGNPHNGPSGKCKITIRNWISLKIAQVSKKKSYYKISRRVLKRYSGGRRNTDEGRSHGSVADLPAVKKEMNRNYFQSERERERVLSNRMPRRRVIYRGSTIYAKGCVNPSNFGQGSLLVVGDSVYVYTQYINESCTAGQPASVLTIKG